MLSLVFNRIRRAIRSPWRWICLQEAREVRREKNFERTVRHLEARTAKLLARGQRNRLKFLGVASIRQTAPDEWEVVALNGETATARVCPDAGYTGPIWAIEAVLDSSEITNR